MISPVHIVQLCINKNVLVEVLEISFPNQVQLNLPLLTSWGRQGTWLSLDNNISYCMQEETKHIDYAHHCTFIIQHAAIGYKLKHKHVDSYT